MGSEMSRTLLALVLSLAFVGSGAVPGSAIGAPRNPDPDAQAHQKDAGKQDDDSCKVGPIPTIGPAKAACKAAGAAKDAITGTAGDVAGSAAGTVAGGVLDQATKWMTNAAAWVSNQIAAGVQKTTTPELQSDWYRARFESMVALGVGLSALVAMMALASAAIRRDPDALGATVYGMLRAGLGTGLVIALTVLALGAADSITNAMAGDFVGSRAGEFWNHVGDAWGKDNFAGFGSSAIAFLFALVQVLAGLAVWIEMLFRSAAIYVAVLFMPAALAAAIWPPLRQWETRLAKALFVLIAMKPVIVTVLALSGYAASAAITGDARGDVGVLLAAIVIFALAACSPWALMSLLAMSSEGTWGARAANAGMRSGLATSGAQVGGSLGTARSVGSRMGGSPGAGGAKGPGTGPSGGSGAPPGGGGRPNGRGPSSGGMGGSGASTGGATGAHASGGAAGASSAAGGAGLAAGAGVGTVAAAAGLGAYATQQTGQRAGATVEHAAGEQGTAPRTPPPPGARRETSGGDAGSRGERGSASPPVRGGGAQRSAPGGGPPTSPAPRAGQQPGGRGQQQPRRPGGREA